MCNQRIAAANRMPQRRRRGWARPGAGGDDSLLRRTLSAILDRGGFDLDIAPQCLRERAVGDGDGLTDALVCAVLARGLDVDGVLAGRERVAAVVLAVPDHRVLPRRAGRLGHLVDQVGLLGPAALAVLLVPTLQVRQPLARTRAAERDPEQEGPDRVP